MAHPTNEHWISDFSIAQPSQAVSATPVQDRWVLIPYEGAEVSGKMLWSPARNSPPDLGIPLPAIGRCKVYVGLYGSGTWPWYFNLIGRYGDKKTWCRLHLRLSDETASDVMVPEHFPNEPRLGYISESLWKTVNLTGQSLVIAPPRKEAYNDTCAFLAYIRLVPVDQPEQWPASTKRLVWYFDANWDGHYVASRTDVESFVNPLAQTDVGYLFWNTAREDSCYYPTKVGNVLPADTMRGVYPYWQGSDLHKMLARGEDPLQVVCETAHRVGLKVFGSYRRMTCRMPPFVFPIHPEGIFVKRPDLWCADAKGQPIPHLSIAQPEVRQRMISILTEQATNYDIDGVHMYFSRAVPFVAFEKPFLDEFQKTHNCDPRTLPETDERLWQVRSACFIKLLRELRQALDQVGQKRGKRFEIAMHCANSVKNCLYYGVDVAQIAREGVLDILLPEEAYFWHDRWGSKKMRPEDVAEFVALAKGTNMRIFPAFNPRTENGADYADVASALYRAGAMGLHPAHLSTTTATGQTVRRLGHVDELDAIKAKANQWSRIVRFSKMAGLTFDMETGVTTCG